MERRVQPDSIEPRERQAIIALELYRLLQAREWQNTAGLADLLLPGILGMLFSFIAGLGALKLLSAALEKGRWKYFGFYCLAASLGVFVAAHFGLLGEIHAD